MSQRPIGFDRKLDIEWLDAAASLVAAGANTRDVRAGLHPLVGRTRAEGAPRGAADKTVTVLARIWSEVPDTVRPLRDRAAALIGEVDESQRLALHWALILAAYPVFKDAMTLAGRLLDLHGNFTRATLERRMKEWWGDRSTLPHVVQRIIRSVMQWGGLQLGPERSTYCALLPRRELPDDVAMILLEALLRTEESHVLPLEQAVRHPSTFPFSLESATRAIRMSPRFEIHRQGMDLEMVGIR